MNKNERRKPLNEGFAPPKLPNHNKDGKKGFDPPRSKPPNPGNSENSGGKK